MKPILRASERDAIFRDAEFQSSDGQTHFEADEQDAPTGGTRHQGWDYSTLVDPTQMHDMVEQLAPTFHVLMDRVQDVGTNAADATQEAHHYTEPVKALHEHLRHTLHPVHGVVRAADRVAIFQDQLELPFREELPDHDYLQHHLGDDEDWGIPRQRTAAQPAFAEEEAKYGPPAQPQLNYQKKAPGSSHGAEIHGDANGGKWLVKKPPPNAPYMADMDVAAGQIAAKSGLEAPMMFKTPTGASAQQMYPGAKDAFPGPVNPQHQSDADLLTIQKHHALDWMLSNHDDHKGNFIRTPDGKLVGIDKGQAMKFINNDRLSWNFLPNEQEPIHNTLYRNFAKGGKQLNDPRQGELGQYIQGLQNIPDEEYRGMLQPYAKGAAAVGELGTDWSGGYTNHLGQPVAMGPKRFEPNDVEGFLNTAVGRKNSLMHDFGELYDKAMAHRATGTKIAMGPDPDTLRSLHKTVGTHDSQLMVDPQGKWLLKKPNKGNEFAVPLDVATAALQAHSGLDSPETYAVPMHDKHTNEPYMASGVKWIPGATQAFKDLPHLHQIPPQDKLELQKHHALDWLLANYDANVGNFMRTPQGKLVGIDKGQAFKYFGQDRLDYNFRPIYYGPEPIHNKLWREFAHGKPGEMLDPRQGELGDYVKNLQGMPDWKLRSMFAPFAHAAANAGMLATGSYSHGGFGPQDQIDPHRGLSEPTIPPNDPSKFLDALVDRKNNLSKDLGDFYDKAAAERKVYQMGPRLGPEEAPPPPKQYHHWAPQHHSPGNNPYNGYDPYAPHHPKQPYQSKMPWAKKPQPVWKSKDYQAKPTLFDDEWGE